MESFTKTTTSTENAPYGVGETTSVGNLGMQTSVSSSTFTSSASAVTSSQLSQGLLIDTSKASEMTSDKSNTAIYLTSSMPEPISSFITTEAKTRMSNIVINSATTPKSEILYSTATKIENSVLK
ncbi:hypothetical protein HDU84_008655 [Entophlyctis sp. JEL0112]|nr:hypothetical protein HDU84_008655 [Entophlyctis sp. JEL0112]